jgi:hypothetical protein
VAVIEGDRSVVVGRELIAIGSDLIALGRGLVAISRRLIGIGTALIAVGDGLIKVGERLSIRLTLDRRKPGRSQSAVLGAVGRLDAPGSIALARLFGHRRLSLDTVMASSQSACAVLGLGADVSRYEVPPNPSPGVPGKGRDSPSLEHSA